MADATVNSARKCITCGTSIDHLFKLRRYCEPHQPRTSTKSMRPCPECGKPSWSKKTRCRDCTNKLPTGCPDCGKPGTKRARCTMCTLAMSDDTDCGECGKPRKILARGMCSSCYSAAYRKAKLVAGICAHCAQDFEGRKGQRYCDSRCQRQANLGIDPNSPPRTKRARKSDFRRRAERTAAKALAGTSGRGRVFVQGNCIMCHTAYVSPGAASRYCSKECRALNRKRVHGLSMLERLAIFERDDWTCQICGEHADWTLHHTSDWYPTLDHIIPRSHGGGHEPENLRTAHAWCNSVRGDLSHYTDADLRA